MSNDFFSKKVFLASDHAGFEIKQELISFLKNSGYIPHDVGAFSYDTDDDYPDFIIPCAQKVAEDRGSLGIILGGSGQGEAMVANKIPGIRAAVFYGTIQKDVSVDINGTVSTDGFDIVRLERQHNNANVLSLGARFISLEEAKEAVQIFLESDFSEDARHVRRLEKISTYETA